MMRLQIVFCDDSGLIVGVAYMGDEVASLTDRLRFAERVAPPTATQLSIARVRSCRTCGCTDDRSCRTASGPCYWVEEDLCSACAMRMVLE